VTDGTRELRLVLTSTDYDNALHLYRDVLGLREEASFTDDNGGRATLLHAGRATLELGDAAHSEAIDALEVGHPSGGPVRVAFEVADATGATDDLVGAGAELVAGPVRTPWGSVNARLTGPDGLPLTVYNNDHYVVARPRLDGPVTLADPDDEWPVTAAALCDGIRSVVGDGAVVLAHVGSTSVPGLAAKPILDLVLGVPDPTDEAAYVPGLESAGYQLRIREPEWREHRLLRRDEPAVNLHVFAAGDEEISAMLAFRDQLRADARDRELYLRTKVELAGRTWEHVQDYADAKADVVADVMSRARPRFATPVRAVWVVVGRTSGCSPLAASLASALGLPLLDADRVAALTGIDDERAAEAVAAMAADTRGAVLHGDLDPQSLTGLPGQVVQPPPLPGKPDAARVAEAIRQVVASAA
jgi:GrpB-like predicted nucleotidyltransferase (UPF0157 family)/catechol 2,3-dioxygenase-like lactoylglutathione lyase family enzyme